MEFIPTIGLEVHAELKTRTKLFCNSKNDPDETRSNVNICPVCMAHPGTLPVLNRAAVRHILRIGLAVGGECADYTEFDRKNYFYPDIPKGYQISQYKYPLVKGGVLSGVELTRIHLEEDTARSLHDKGDYSLIDFNRAGVPLMELVTEPLIHSAEEAGGFARELQLLLRTLEAGEANMEKGEMRVEANVSVAPTGELGTKVEVKNLNSFRAVERAINFEVKRQSELRSKGEKIVQETRGWDENKEKTFSQRLKEESHDYRYFPDPDVPKLLISKIPEFSKEALEKDMPELPWEKRDRFVSTLGMSPEAAEMFLHNTNLSLLFEEAAEELNEEGKKLLINYITSDLAGLIKSKDIQATLEYVHPKALAKLVAMVQANEISSRGAKDVLLHLAQGGGNPRAIAEEQGLFQRSDEGELVTVVEKIVKEHAAVAKEYREGKEASLQFLVGQGMKETKGAANPQVLAKLLREKLG